MAEWKWDGIRVQLAAGGGTRRLFSRSGDDIAAAFPDLVAAADFDAVVDGELLVARDGEIAPFSDLQQRLNRKTVSARMLERSPAHLRLYDGGRRLRRTADHRHQQQGWLTLTLPKRNLQSHSTDPCQ